MNQKHLLRFIKKCMRSKADEYVCLDKNTAKPITLKQVSLFFKLIIFEMLAYGTIGNIGI